MIGLTWLLSSECSCSPIEARGARIVCAGGVWARRHRVVEAWTSSANGEGGQRLALSVGCLGDPLPETSFLSSCDTADSDGVGARLAVS